MAPRVAVLAALVALATLTRETAGLLIALSVLAAYPRRIRLWLPLLGLVAGLMIALRLAIMTTPCCTPAHVWASNTTPWRLAGAARHLGLLLPLLVLCARGLYRSSPPLQRRIASVLLPYLALIGLFGVWQETRLLMPVFILSIPALPYALSDQRN